MAAGAQHLCSGPRLPGQGSLNSSVISYDGVSFETLTRLCPPKGKPSPTRVTEPVSPATTWIRPCCPRGLSVADFPLAAPSALLEGLPTCVWPPATQQDGGRQRAVSGGGGLGGGETVDPVLRPRVQLNRAKWENWQELPAPISRAGGLGSEPAQDTVSWTASKQQPQGQPGRVDLSASRSPVGSALSEEQPTAPPRPCALQGLPRRREGLGHTRGPPHRAAWPGARRRDLHAVHFHPFLFCSPEGQASVGFVLLNAQTWVKQKASQIAARARLLCAICHSRLNCPLCFGPDFLKDSLDQRVHAPDRGPVRAPRISRQGRARWRAKGLCKVSVVSLSPRKQKTPSYTLAILFGRGGDEVVTLPCTRKEFGNIHGKLKLIFLTDMCPTQGLSQGPLGRCQGSRQGRPSHAQPRLQAEGDTARPTSPCGRGSQTV